jgi:hypothetical protein
VFGWERIESTSTDGSRYSTSTSATDRVGKLTAVIVPSSSFLQLDHYVPTTDCAVTNLPMLTRQGCDVLHITLRAGMRVDVICVTYFKTKYRFNDKVAPLALEIN